MGDLRGDSSLALGWQYYLKAGVGERGYNFPLTQENPFKLSIYGKSSTSLQC